MSSEGQANAVQLPAELFRVDDIHRLQGIDPPTKAKFVPAFQQLWSAVETKPADSMDYKKAISTLTEWSQKLRNQERAWQARRVQTQAQAQPGQQPSQQSGQQPGARPPQQQQQQQQQIPTARPQVPVQAPNSLRPQNQSQPNMPGQPVQAGQASQQYQIPSNVRQHVESLQIVLPPTMAAGTPEAEKQLNDMKQSYMVALAKMESAKIAVNRIREAMERAKAQGEDTAQLQARCNGFLQLHAGSKQFAEDFRKKQVQYKQGQQGNQQQPQQNPQAQPAQKPLQPSQPPPSQQPPAQQQPGSLVPQQATAQQNQPQQAQQPSQVQQAQPPQPQQQVQQAAPGAQIKQENVRQPQFSPKPPGQGLQQPPHHQVPSGAPGPATSQLNNRSHLPPGSQGLPTSNQPPQIAQSPTTSLQTSQGPGMPPSIQIPKPNIPLNRPNLPPQHPQHINTQLQHSPSTAQNPNQTAPPIPLSHQAAVTAAAQSYSSQQQTPTHVVTTPTQGYYSGNREQPNMNNPKMPIPKQLEIPRPQPVSMGPSRPTMGNGAPGMIGQPVINKMGTFQLEGDSDRVLSKKKLDELVRQVTGGDGVAITPEVEEILLQLADEFVDNVTTAACRLSRLRESATLDIRDLQLVLERNYNMRIPGYASDDVRTVRKVLPAPGWTQKMNAVQAAKVMGGKTDI